MSTIIYEPNGENTEPRYYIGQMEWMGSGINEETGLENDISLFNRLVPTG